MNNQIIENIQNPNCINLENIFTKSGNVKGYEERKEEHRIKCCGYEIKCGSCENSVGTSGKYNKIPIIIGDIAYNKCLIGILQERAIQATTNFKNVINEISLLPGLGYQYFEAMKSFYKKYHSYCKQHNAES